MSLGYAPDHIGRSPCALNVMSVSSSNGNRNVVILSPAGREKKYRPAERNAMNTKEALREARKRWGKKSGVYTWKCADGKILYRVGAEFMGTAFEVKGEGSNWTEAFQQADKKHS